MVLDFSPIACLLFRNQPILKGYEKLFVSNLQAFSQIYKCTEVDVVDSGE